MKAGTFTTRAVCAVCFVLFSFLWLYCFQADMLAVAQHRLSGGVTHYNRTVGATLITLVLLLLQLAVHALTRLSRRTHALTYVPSFLCLAFVSDISVVAGTNSVVMGRLWWLLAVVFVVWTGAVWLARQMLPFNNDTQQHTRLLSARTWMNVAQMAVMMLFVALVGNTDSVLHYRAHAETALLRGDSREAMRVGWESLETDRQLTMLRAYALSLEGLLGEKLFCYPVEGGGDALLPQGEEPLLLPADSIWRHLGGKPAFTMRPQSFFRMLEEQSLATPAVADDALCCLLADKDLDGFVRLLPTYYDTQHAPTLPRHFREALVLYRYQHPGSLPDYDDEVVEKELELMVTTKEQYPEGSEQRLQMIENFRTTYWYYYYDKVTNKGV